MIKLSYTTTSGGGTRQEDPSYQHICNTQKYLAAMGLDQSNHQQYAENINYVQTPTTLYGPQTLQKLATDPKFEE
jgi:hypothetical protein